MKIDVDEILGGGSDARSAEETLPLNRRRR